MKYLLILSLFLMSFNENKGCLEMDIVILADLSGSVENYEPFVIEAIIGLIDKIDISEQSIRIGVIGFNSIPFTIAGLSGNKEELNSIIHQFEFKGENGTFMSQALRMVYNELVRDRQYARKMMIIISDGEISDDENSLLTAKQLEAVNIGICGVLIKNNSSNAQFMKDIAGVCYVETSYENLAMELAKMDICL